MRVDAGFCGLWRRGRFGPSVRTPLAAPEDGRTPNFVRWVPPSLGATARQAEGGLDPAGGVGGYTVVFIRYTATTRINIGDSSLFDRYTSRYHP